VEGFGERETQDFKIQDARQEGKTRSNEQNVRRQKTEDKRKKKTMRRSSWK